MVGLSITAMGMHVASRMRLISIRTCSSGFKLDHPAPQSQLTIPSSTSPPSNIPICPLLIQHPVPAFLAPDRVAALERDFGVAVAAEIVHGFGRVFEGGRGGVEAGVAGACLAGELVLRLGEGGRGVGFAGHGCGFGVGRWEGVGLI